MNEPQPNQEIKDTFDFVVSEFVRHAQMSPEEIRDSLKHEWFCDIHDREGHRRPIGRTAYERLRALAEASLSTSVWNGRIDPDRAFKAVLKGFGRDFIHPEFASPTAGEVSEAIARWLAEAGEACQTRTHYVPCLLGLEGADSFVLGPVSFHTTEALLDELAAPLANFSRKKDPVLRERALEAFHAYYSAFTEVAAVVVPACDPPTSRRRAAEAVQVVVDYLHVMAGAAFTSKVRVGGPAVKADGRASLTLDDTGEAEITWSWGREGGRLGEGFWAELQDLRHRPINEGMSLALSAVLRGEQSPILAARFMDACRWYADAARDPSPAAAAVKYLTSMERLLWTTDARGSTKRIAERAAALCFSTLTWNFDELKGAVEKAYGVRSAVVHGRIAPADPTIRASLRLCEEVARDLLMQWCERFAHGFGRDVTLHQLHDHLESFTAEAKQVAMANRLSPSFEAPVSPTVPGLNGSSD